ncbi:MAG: adenylate kinase [Candidatus Diapherotrites archaeon]|uniref:Adenylate kinase n=1 Tax=Candidatus Iainarchaeum sp. TaxID=3101447 RepID=A0A939C4I7_9ARCH|nr:adenylate kinase [Candidatus Diapherotrites archaeon]
MVFLGPPGAGKGTIAQAMAEAFGITQISTGSLLREEVESQTELGKKAKAIMDAGQYVDDETVASIVENKLASMGKEKGFILDGFPRTIKQAEMLESIMQKLGIALDAVLDIEASDDTIIERLGGRVQCSKCGKVYNLKNVPPEEEGKCDGCSGKLVKRDDDKPEIIKMRLETYRKKTEPLISHYREKRLLLTIDANGALKENIDNAEKALKRINEKKGE